MNAYEQMRDALVKIYREVRSYCFDYGAGESHKSLVDRMVEDPPDYTSYRDSILEIDSIVEAALALPRRNCDVGTAEEQYSRFDGYCATHAVAAYARCKECPMKNELDCRLAWAQMPYEAERNRHEQEG